MPSQPCEKDEGGPRGFEKERRREDTPAKMRGGAPSPQSPLNEINMELEYYANHQKTTIVPAMEAPASTTR